MGKHARASCESFGPRHTIINLPSIHIYLNQMASADGGAYRSPSCLSFLYLPLIYYVIAIPLLSSPQVGNLFRLNMLLLRSLRVLQVLGSKVCI